MPLRTINTGDCVKLLPKLPAGRIDLVFADPPFNIGYEYDVYHDRRAKADYLAWADQWLAAAVRVLKPDGSFFLAIGDEFVAEHKVKLDALGLTMRNWIVWHYTFGVSCTKKFDRSHAHILYYVRDPKNYQFFPDDTWVLRPQESEDHFQPDSDTWYVPRGCDTFEERTGHPCQMPEAVLKRIIRATTKEGDWVL